jgi:hypothetical protein
MVLSGWQRPTGREIAVWRKKKKKKRNNYKPHICRGFRFKLSSQPRVKEGIRK